MKETLVVICGVILLAACGASAANITPAMIAQTPTVYCQVVEQPDPAFLGGWMTEVENNKPVEFWLVKIGNRYGFYHFFRDNEKFKKKAPYAKWRKMYIKKDVILSPSSMFRFSLDKGQVYYQFKGGKPWNMKRIEAK
jgi:hypothetical protein